MRTGIVRTDAFEMRYFTFGEGKKNFVIIPGLDAKSIIPSAKMIENAYSAFSKDYTVTVFDRRTDIPDPYSIREMARDTALAMKELHIKDAHIFGASQGGMIAQYIGIDYPEIVSSLILASTICKANPIAVEVIGNWIKAAESGDRRALSKAFVESLFSKPFQEKYGDILITLNDHITDEDLRRFIILARSIERFDATRELCKIHCPVFVIGSLGDRVVGGDSSRELAEYLDCKLYLYDENSSHCVFDEAPDYKERIIDFLNSI